MSMHLFICQSVISQTMPLISTSHSGQSNKKNREAILRKRAKQREAYLKELESKGLYDPNKTPQTKPDPERWIPKSQRSYNRRGRRGRYNSNIGAQGGGAGAGMERDAQKLDVAARVAAAKSGAANGTGKLSTANMQAVSGSGQARKGKKRR
jgi:signal recognition particle subunit SRP72